jgi:hypothetical protein
VGIEIFSRLLAVFPTSGLGFSRGEKHRTITQITRDKRVGQRGVEKEGCFIFLFLVFSPPAWNFPREKVLRSLDGYKRNGRARRPVSLLPRNEMSPGAVRSDHVLRKDASVRVQRSVLMPTLVVIQEPSR